MGENPKATESGRGAAVIAFVAMTILCSGIPAVVICAGMGASFTDIMQNFFNG